MMNFFIAQTPEEFGFMLGRMNYLGGGVVVILKEGIETYMTWGHLVAFMEACT
jgi:hypothetical protein